MNTRDIGFDHFFKMLPRLPAGVQALRLEHPAVKRKDSWR
jgi:hypothetical protein